MKPGVEDFVFVLWIASTVACVGVLASLGYATVAGVLGAGC